MRKLLASLVFLAAVLAARTAPASPANLAQLQRIARSLKDEVEKSVKSTGEPTPEQKIRLEQTRSVIEDLKAMIKKGARNLRGSSGSKAEPRKTQQEPIDQVLNILDQYFNYIPKKLGIPVQTRTQKAASLVGQGLLLKGIMSKRHRNQQHRVLVRELETKMKARELYINSVDRNKSQLQAVSDRLGSQADYFTEKKNSLTKFFNGLINYSE